MMSLPAWPSNVVFPEKPLASMVFALAPPVSNARLIPARIKLPPLVRTRVVLVRTKLVSPASTTLSLPPEPVSVALPLNPVTSKELSEAPPARLAWVTPYKTKLTPVARVRLVSVRTKSVSLVETTVSVPPPPLSVTGVVPANPVQPETSNRLFPAPPLS